MDFWHLMQVLSNCYANGYAFAYLTHHLTSQVSHYRSFVPVTEPALPRGRC